MRRPDVFTLDYSHPLAQGLIFGLFGNRPGSSIAEDSSINAQRCTISNGLRWTQFLGRNCLGSISPTAILTASLPLVEASSPATICWQHYARSTGLNSTTGRIAAGSLGVIFSNGTLDSVSFSPSMGFSINATLSASLAARPTHICASYSHSSCVIHEDAVARASVTGSKVDVSGTFALFNRSGSDRAFDGIISDFCIYNRALSPAEIALLADRTDPMLGGLIVEERPVLWFDMGGSAEDKIGPFAITVDSSLGLSGFKGAKGSVSIDHEAAIHASGSKSAKGSTVFSAGAEFLAGGAISQSDDKLGAAIFVDESAVGIGGIKNAFGSFAITNASTFGVGCTTGVFMPELSQASGAAVSSGEIDGSVYTNKNTGTLYAVATLSSTKPSVAQVQAGQNHLGAAAKYSTSQSVTTYGLQAVRASGLASYTEHYWHFQHKDAGGLDSTVITSPAVRTLDISIPLAFSDTAPATLLTVQVWSRLPKKAEAEGLY